MLRLMALAVLGTLLPSCSRTTFVVDEKPSPIIAGTMADDATYDAIGVLHSELPGLFCTGTLISPTVVLTAKHCLKSAHETAGRRGRHLRNGEAGIRRLSPSRRSARGHRSDTPVLVVETMMRTADWKGSGDRTEKFEFIGVARVAPAAMKAF
jgi:hypothetical protein